MVRDPISEILSKRSRVHLRGARWEKFNRRMMPIMKASVELANTTALAQKSKGELFRYFPIAVVGALEGYFRIAYADLINSGEPYAGRVRDFQDMKFRPSAVLAIQGRRVSAGELIAHLLPHNSFSDIETNMSVLLGNKFSSTLSSKEFSGIAILARGLNPWPALVSDITEMFKLRHIFCHELATKVRLSTSRSYQLCQAGVLLAMMTDILLTDLLDKGKALPTITA